VKSEIAGNVWKIQTKPGDRIEVEGEIMILESMKMEIPVLSPKAGIIRKSRSAKARRSAKASSSPFLMRSSAVAVEIVRLWAPDNLRRVAPGVALCAVIAAVAFVADKQNSCAFGAVWIPPLILTLVIGMALQPLSDRAVLKPGIEFAGRTLLRVGVALYGARLTFGQLVDGGALPVLIALAAVSCTIVFGAWAARLFGLSRDFGR